MKINKTNVSYSQAAFIFFPFKLISQQWKLSLHNQKGANFFSPSFFGLLARLDKPKMETTKALSYLETVSKTKKNKK